MSVHLMIGGDVSPTTANLEAFSGGDVSALLNEALRERWLDADFRFFNLEIPLMIDRAPIAKCGPVLGAPVTVIRGIQALAPSLVGLANNHILDQGSDSLMATLAALDEVKIAHLGAGADLCAAREPCIFEKDGVKIGFLACAEHEFSIAQEHRAGANPFDALETPDQVAALKERCNYVVVLYHGGKEYYRYPSPDLRKICRKLVEKGADVVLCQHSHCIGCLEKYGEGQILYGQGNFIFNKYAGREEWDHGLLIELTADAQGLRLEPLVLTRQDVGVRLASEEERSLVSEGLSARSAEIAQEGFVEANYEEMSQDAALNYLAFFGGNKAYWFCFRKLYKMLGCFFVKRFFKKSYLLAMQDYLECESHHELLLAGIRRMAGS